MAIPKPLKHVAEFEGMGLGMFVHWGLYSQLAQGEWIYERDHMEMDEYKKLKDTFTAEDFDADTLVLTAKNAGCRYITLTTKHHEGFFLYDSMGINGDYDAPHSPAKRDLIREFVDACNRHGIVPFFYHATLDWSRPEFNTDFDAYLEYIRKSVEILCKNYGKIGGLWFDGNWSKKGADWKEDELYATIRKYQPEAIIVNNTGLSNRGETGNPEIDSVTFEQGRPTPMNREGMKKYLASEMCHTLNDHWGIAQNDFNFQSPRSIIEHLCACRRVGANYLLNIGPTAQGGIEPMTGALMGILGKWMKLYGEAIYEGHPHPATCAAQKNFILKGKDCLYAFIHDLGISGNPNVTVNEFFGAEFTFDGVTENIESVKWMDNGEELEFAQKGAKLGINATPFRYGANTCVRVAKIKLK